MGHLHSSTRTQLNIQSSQGMVLIVTLLFLLVLTLLAIGIFETSMVQARMQKSYRDKTLSLQNAENALRLAEKQIADNINKGEQSSSEWSYQFYPTKENFCLNKNCYLINAVGKKNQVLTTLQTIYVVESIPQPDGSKRIKKYVAVWAEKP